MTLHIVNERLLLAMLMNADIASMDYPSNSGTQFPFCKDKREQENSADSRQKTPIFKNHAKLEKNEGGHTVFPAPMGHSADWVGAPYLAWARKNDVQTMT